MIFVDSDGVCADFDTHYENLFGVRPTRWPDEDNVDWKLVNSVPDFFLTLPRMKDFDELIEGLKPREWTTLTGCPKSISVSDNQKRDWFARELHPNHSVICCRAREKCLHGKPGDILIDDYLKYRDLWVDMGGIFIHHTSARYSLAQLRKLESIGKYHD